MDQSVLTRDSFLADPLVNRVCNELRELLSRDWPDESRLDSKSESLSVDGSVSEVSAGTTAHGGISPVPPFHRYTHRSPRYKWWCHSLLDAAAQYRFPIESKINDPIAVCWAGYDSLRASAHVLSQLQKILRRAYAEKNDSDTAQVAIDIQTWGGTENGNVNAINALNTGGRRFCEYLALCERAFGQGKKLDPSVFNSSNYELRSNAGFTKIYSLLFDQFVIYDSRVAAALGMLIGRSCQNLGITTIPPLLKLIWMPARTRGVRRDPSFATYRFDKVPGYPKTANQSHVSCNVRTNWFLSKVVTGTPFEAAVQADRYWMPVTPLRALEAALFMIGYDLSGNNPYP